MGSYEAQEVIFSHYKKSSHVTLNSRGLGGFFLLQNIYLSLLEIFLNLLTMKNPIRRAMMAMHTVLMMVVTVSNLSLNTLVEILLKYQRLRKIDSKRKQTKVVCTRNFQNDTLRNPKENCPGTERGGVILTISRERKKFFLALRSRYFRRGFSSNMCILEKIQSPERQLQENKSLEIGFLFF